MSRWLDEFDETGGSVSTVLNYVPDEYIKSIVVNNRNLIYTNQNNLSQSVNLDNNTDNNTNNDSSNNVVAASTGGVPDVYIESVSFANGAATVLTKTKDDGDISTTISTLPEVYIKSASVADGILTIVDQAGGSTDTPLVSSSSSSSSEGRTIRAVINANGNILKTSDDGLTCVRETNGKYILSFPDRTDTYYVVHVMTEQFMNCLVREFTTGSFKVWLTNTNKKYGNIEFRVTITEIA